MQERQGYEGFAPFLHGVVLGSGQGLELGLDAGESVLQSAQLRGEPRLELGKDGRLVHEFLDGFAQGFPLLQRGLDPGELNALLVELGLEGLQRVGGEGVEDPGIGLEVLAEEEAVGVRERDAVVVARRDLPSITNEGVEAGRLASDGDLQPQPFKKPVRKCRSQGMTHVPCTKALAHLVVAEAQPIVKRVERLAPHRCMGCLQPGPVRMFPGFDERHGSELAVSEVLPDGR